VTSCSQLENAIEDALVLEMKSSIEQIRKSDVWISPMGIPTAAGPGRPEAAGPAGGSGPTSVSTTNTQVAGVDEADFVQNDGTRIAVLAGGRLHLISSWPADAMAETASLPIDGWARDMFLSGDQVVVFSMVYVPRGLEGSHPICAPPPGPVAAASAAFCGYWASDVTQITTIDVSDMSNPKITAVIRLPGSYDSARRIDQRVRLVMSDNFPFPDGVKYWPDLPPGASTADRNKAFDALEAANETLIRGRSLDDWLRKGEVTIPGGSTTPISYNCSDFSLSSAPSRPGLLIVATVDLTTDSLKSRSAVLAEPGTVYASKDTLYVAASHWWWWPEPGQIDATYVHAFDLTDPDSAPYLGSGTVDGTVSDQYAMDEFGGALRVATHLTTRVDDGTTWGTLQSSNRISVLALQGGKLNLVGKTADYGANEQTYGTRFVGTRGFVITAKQVDPLFTFDLSDPTHPVEVGELSMPGFIAYLHPIDDTHLLGIGREVTITSTSETAQVKVALLDVTDLANPKQVGPPVLVGSGFAYSEALWDPHAFTWLPSQNMLAIPFVDYGSTNFVSDLRLFKVDPASGITALGSLSMKDVFLTYSYENWSWSWSPSVRRGILADSPQGQFVYAISDAGVRSAKVADLPAWLKTVTFPPLVF
jgi:uncharacterized secreted protein with C-terminal beta-propeller domain